MQSYDVGAVDGVWGKRTKGALISFKSDQQLPEDPTLQATVERLVRLHQAAVSTERGTLPEDLMV
jgi:peptidoglycan hydrolase-like protein with peptidoglycan-binding domain